MVFPVVNVEENALATVGVNLAETMSTFKKLFFI